jgi:hypothetical protein
VQGNAGHPGLQGGGQEKNNRKKLSAEEEERRKGSLTKKEPLGNFLLKNSLRNISRRRVA